MYVCSLHLHISSNKILPTNDAESQITNQGEERKKRKKKRNSCYIKKLDYHLENESIWTKDLNFDPQILFNNTCLLPINISFDWQVQETIEKCF